MRNTLVRLLGWRATVLQGDPTVIDRWRWLKRHLKPGPLRTLDAGCGTGAYTLYAAKIGNSAVGVSFDPAQITRARARAAILGISSIEFREGDLRKLDESATSLGTFDQIIVFETIEHIKNDQKLVDDLAALLKPGGVILLTAPYAHHRALWGEKLSEIEDGGHVRWGYTHEELRAIFERAGLKVVAEEYVSGLVSQKLASLQFGLGRLNPHSAWGLTFPLRVLHPLDGPLTRLTSYPHLSVGVVGCKPAASA
jgi:SAM-dependent methyltransferase